MGSIILKLSLIALLVGFLAFLAWDDYRSRKARAAEDRARQAALDTPERRRETRDDDTRD